MTCKCGSERIMLVSGKTSDMFSARFAGKNYHGYVPDNIGLGGGDYIEFSYCVDCGSIQSNAFPISKEFDLEEVDDY